MKKVTGKSNAFSVLFLLAIFLGSVLLSGCGSKSSNSTNQGTGQSFEELMGDKHFYFGNLHSHTDNSDGEGTPEEAFTWARDTAKFDFYAITDHAEYLTLITWKDTVDQANAFNDNGSFVAISGFEWSHAYDGHICVWNTENYMNAILTPFIELFYLWLDDNNGIAQFNHPGREKGVFRNLKYNKSVADNLVAIETGNKDDGNNDGEYLAYYPDGLDMGWKVAPTSNQDNHSLSANCHRTVIIAEELTRETLLEAIQARRMYSTDDPNMKVIFKCGDAWMGSEVSEDSDTLTFSIAIEDDEKISKIELITDGGETIAQIAPNATSAQWAPTVTIEKECYFYVQVTEENTRDEDDGKTEQIAVTAPIWVEVPEEELEVIKGSWYKGDLHAHSTNSDGDVDVASVIEYAENEELDFFVLTEHNNVKSWDHPNYESRAMTLLYGVEWTSDKGHANIWSDAPFDWDMIQPTVEAEDAKAAISAAHGLAQNGQTILFSINHPYAPGCEWEYSYVDSKKADCMEVWNAGYLWPNFNSLTLSETLNTYLKNGKKISMVGGSDSHIHGADYDEPINYVQTMYHDIGMPTTWVFAKSQSAKDILQGIKKGHVSISRAPNGPRVELIADPDYQEGEPEVYELMMGDSIPASALGKEVRFRVRVFDAKMSTFTAGPSAVLVMKNGVLFDGTVGMSEDYCFDFTDTPEEGDYYYVELRQTEFTDVTLLELTQLGGMVGLTNPIYTW